MQRAETVTPEEISEIALEFDRGKGAPAQEGHIWLWPHARRMTRSEFLSELKGSEKPVLIARVAADYSYLIWPAARMPAEDQTRILALIDQQMAFLEERVMALECDSKNATVRVEAGERSVTATIRALRIWAKSVLCTGVGWTIERNLQGDAPLRLLFRRSDGTWSGTMSCAWPQVP